LKGNDGVGLDGHEVIALIRKHNQDCEIVFYSSNATQAELRELAGAFANVTCTLREDLPDVLVRIASR
jgi:CheY-like chemotaxis protein